VVVAAAAAAAVVVVVVVVPVLLLFKYYYLELPQAMPAVVRLPEHWLWNKYLLGDASGNIERSV
jgi:uncharacterized membrane protein YsdA (DUF1294 family)